MRPSDRAREAACFDVLRELQDSDAVLIGGYAVSAYGRPRFSVDLDFVLPASEVTRFRGILGRLGFREDEATKPAPVFAVRFERWAKGSGASSVSVDLLIDGVYDRRTGVVQTYDTLKHRATRRLVTGVTPTSSAEFAIPDAEALIALKIPPGRNADLRDIATLAGSVTRREDIATLLLQCPPAVVLDRATKILALLETRPFQDSLKGSFMLGQRAYERVQREARELCLWLRQRFSESGRES